MTNAFVLGAFAAALGIALGAFGAHALSGIEPEKMSYWAKATQYHFVAAFGLLAAGALEWHRQTLLRGPSVLFVLGIVLFSGSLYAMTLGAPRWFGAITPLGGLALIGGFVWLGIAALGSS
jgi:uncharacterized membrane protein YgdD (TMEM256/DUF423 family)